VPHIQPDTELKEKLLERVRFELNHERALSFCFDAFSSREPVSTSLENALTLDASEKFTTKNARQMPGALVIERSIARVIASLQSHPAQLPPFSADR
jgi:hypothetical protein